MIVRCYSLICLFILSQLLLICFTGSVDYKVFELDGSPKDLQWCGSSRDTILVITEGNSLYRSEDKGFSWKKLNDILLSKAKDTLDPEDNEIGKVSEMIPSPVDKSLIIFIGTHGINWVTEDCGKKITALNHGRKIQEFSFHPVERTWVLASAFTLCEDFDNEPCKKYKEVYVTKDLGQSWTVLLSYVVQFGWGITGEKHIKAGIPKERIIVSYEPKGKGDQKHGGWNYKIDLIYSDDFLKTKKIACHKGNKFLLTDDYLFVAQVVDQEVQEVMLLVSDSKKFMYNFEPISINKGKFTEHSYTFLDTTEGSVFLHVNHYGENSKYGNVYISDSRGTKYSISLSFNIRSADNQCDFEKFESIEGIYISNAIDPDKMKELSQEIQKEALNEDTKMDNKKTTKEKPVTSNDVSKDFITTLISFNKGGSWERLKAPVRGLDGQQYDCGSNCFLNLHGISGDFPPFYTVNSAAGIILGNGNVGQYLSHNPAEISTFLSRDGGNTWFEVRKGSHTYEIGDHGGLIILADDQNPTDSILYSWDEGLTWQDLRISSNKLMVRNIIIEPTSTGLHFVLYGEMQSKKGKKTGLIVGLNFTTLNERRCEGAEQPDAPGSDYEKWILSNSEGRGCLLGRKIIYVRRKREVECYNGIDFERKNIIENCDCTDSDYECDEGFHRPKIDEGCVPIESSKTKLPIEGEIHQAPENCSGYFTISKGYRKIPGNSCVNGVKYDPIIVPCPYSGFFSVMGILFFLFIIIILVALVIMAFNKDFIDSVKDFINERRSQGNVHPLIMLPTDKPEDYADLSDSNPDTDMLFDDNDLNLSNKQGIHNA